MGPRQLEDEIVVLPTSGEVLLGVVDDVICAERSDQLYVPRAAHAGHLGVEGLGDLYGQGPYASRRTDDQDLVPRLDPPVVAQTLQGSRRGQGHGRRLVEREVGRFRCQEIFRDTYTLSKRTKTVHEWAPKDLITRLERRDVLAY